MCVAFRRRYRRGVDRAVCPPAARPGRLARYTCVAPCQVEEHVACWDGERVGSNRVGCWDNRRSVFLSVLVCVTYHTCVSYAVPGRSVAVFGDLCSPLCDAVGGG